MRKLLIAILIGLVALGAVVSIAEPAEAAPLRAGAVQTQACDRCLSDLFSLPYIDDVNEWGKGKSVATIAVCGKGKTLKKASVKVVDCKTRKRVRADRLGVHVWAGVLKNGHVYKITVKVRNESKSIYYGVCK